MAWHHMIDIQEIKKESDRKSEKTVKRNKNKNEKKISETEERKSFNMFVALSFFSRN